MMQLLFLHVLHLDVLRRQIEIETESEDLCMAIMLDHPWQSLYTQYYYTDELLYGYLIRVSVPGYICM